MLCPDVDPLWCDVVVDAPEDQDTNGMWRNVPNLACATVVKTMWHTRMNSTIHMDVNNVSDLECAETL